ncbi:hypothetical protein BDV30DRAFT_239051 [Aspergillus minisclerotigenes]|uniref:Uncharacterized protein n=1 Tax=Aspergillus minisclerotigenes TaxID=656917 RepID=A0A5N6J2S9_9EURO|nr:hypothetical protein BDV30DRAFT_239051 [Aspergillus minisclerotigenes]
MARLCLSSDMLCECCPFPEAIRGQYGPPQSPSWVIDDHGVLIARICFQNFAELNKVNSDPESQALQMSEESFVNRVYTMVSLFWLERYVDEGMVVPGLRLMKM